MKVKITATAKVNLIVEVNDELAKKIGSEEWNEVRNCQEWEIANEELPGMFENNETTATIEYIDEILYIDDEETKENLFSA